MRFSRLSREKPISSRSRSISAAKAATSSSTSVIQPTQSSRTRAAETRRANQAAAPECRGAGQRGERAARPSASPAARDRRASAATGAPACRHRVRRLGGAGLGSGSRERLLDDAGSSGSKHAAGAAGLGRSCEPVPQQELDGPVEPDVRQGRLLAGGASRELMRGGRKRRKWTLASARRLSAQAASSGSPGPPAGRPGIPRPPCAPSNSLAAQALARQRHADDARQPLPARLAPPPRASP